MNIFAEMAKYNIINKKMQASDNVRNTKQIENAGIPTEWEQIATLFFSIGGAIRIKGSWSGTYGRPSLFELRDDSGEVVSSFQTTGAAITFDFDVVDVKSLSKYFLYVKLQNPSGTIGMENLKINLCYDVVEKVAGIS